MNKVVWNGKSISPSKVVCIGRNYAKHIAELKNTFTGDMVVFMKPNASISETLYAVHDEPLHYEGEICFLVEGGAFAGVGFGLDLTKRQLQTTLKNKQLPWERAKSFTGAAVLSEFIPLARDVDFSLLSLELWIDDELVQKGGVSDMLFAPNVILEDVQGFIALEDGDIIMTGTPEGVGEVTLGATYKGCIWLGDTLLLESIWQAQ